jgi:hypothetical protein
MILHTSGASRRGNAEVYELAWLFEIESEITLAAVPLAAFEFVMPGLVPGIHVLSSLKQKNVDGRDI